MSFKLRQTKQCKTCPWKVGANPYDIPNGYSVDLHKGLKDTIAQDIRLTEGAAMACHYSETGKENYCIGWLVNQLGVGNNIGLRIKMMGCENAKDIKSFGEQHERFEDTLPNEN